MAQPHRFTIPTADAWQKHYDTTHVLSLLNERSRPFRDADWDGFFLNMAPQAKRRDGRFYQWRVLLQQDLAAIRANVPREVMNVVSMPEPTDSEIIAITDPTTEETEYAETEDTELGRVYHELWLDLSRRPHLTGRDLQPAARARFARQLS